MIIMGGDKTRRYYCCQNNRRGRWDNEKTLRAELARNCILSAVRTRQEDPIAGREEMQRYFADGKIRLELGADGFYEATYHLLPSARPWASSRRCGRTRWRRRICAPTRRAGCAGRRPSPRVSAARFGRVGNGRVAPSRNAATQAAAGVAAGATPRVSTN